MDSFIHVYIEFMEFSPPLSPLSSILILIPPPNNAIHTLICFLFFLLFKFVFDTLIITEAVVMSTSVGLFTIDMPFPWYPLVHSVHREQCSESTPMPDKMETGLTLDRLCSVNHNYIDFVIAWPCHLKDRVPQHSALASGVFILSSPSEMIPELQRE